MAKCVVFLQILIAIFVPTGRVLAAQDESGSIRGSVTDADFEVPLVNAKVLVVELNREVRSTEQGNFLFTELPAGRYTIVFSKSGYSSKAQTDVVVFAGQQTEVNADLSGEFTEMEEFIVQDFQIGTGSEEALLDLRFESPSLMDSISRELMSRVGASDAGEALKTIPGATVQDGKYAVIRGLPDRYVSSQVNGVRLPGADVDKRAVQLDQFPSSVIESIQVTKTFTPDQQGDASGGAVDVRMSGIPDETILQVNIGTSYNGQVQGQDDFLGYEGGDREVQPIGAMGQHWTGDVGVSEEDAPTPSKWSAAFGGTRMINREVRIGGFASLFSERSASFYEGGTNDSMWVESVGAPMTPQTLQGAYSGNPSAPGDFKTALFDVSESVRTEQFGGLGAFGLETDNHFLGLTYLYSRTEDDKATLATDTRGKEFFFPGYDPNDPTGLGNLSSNEDAAPYIRTETLQYTKRETGTLQLNGRHTLPFEGFRLGSAFKFLNPVLSWTLSSSFAESDQPDKRQFGARWFAERFDPGAPPFIPPSIKPATWLPFRPAANTNLGNLQRVFTKVDEDSEQVAANLEFPFEQWDGVEGHFRVGLFRDKVVRNFDQDTFFNDDFDTYLGTFSEPWSAVWSSQNHPIVASEFDIDYRGDQKISATYGMLDLPVSDTVRLISGARFETTKIGIVNDPEQLALWYPPGTTVPTALTPGAADVTFEENNVLPSISLIYSPTEAWTFRGAYSRTVARQTFKELSPIIQQEFVGGPVFIGNPSLEMSRLENFDLRADFTPYDGGLISLSWFHKNIDDAIENIQEVGDFNFTTPVNYPEGELTGMEFEVRQDLGHFTDRLSGLALGANATVIDSEVSLPSNEVQVFQNLGVPFDKREATNAPEHLYNIYLTYDLEKTRTQFTLFYTVRGDTLVAGAAESLGNFVPSIYAKEFGTLNFGVNQQLGDHFNLRLQAKNLTNPVIEQVYRSEYIGEDVRNTSFQRGVQYSLTLGARFSF